MKISTARVFLVLETVLVVASAARASATASSTSPAAPRPRTYVFGRASFVTGNSPVAIAREDLDGDGIADLVTANTAGGTLSVLLAAEHGAFAAHVENAVGTGPDALAIGDLDGDGKPDLVAVNQNCPNGTCGAGSVSVLLGNGDGTFQSATPFATNTNPRSVAIGDFNGDGMPDLAVVNAITTITQGPGTVSILIGNGDGSFQPGVEFPAGSGVGAIVSADFDGDGKLDLAITNFVGLAVLSAVAVLHGNGDGSFQAPVAFTTGNGPVGLVAADFNADGKLDIATVDLGANAISMLAGNGDGTFQAHVDSPAGFGPKSISVGDLDQDGKLDLALTAFTSISGGGSVVILRGNGDGSFQPSTEYVTGQNGPAIVVGDIDGDGKQDVVIPDLTHHVTVLVGRGDGTLAGAASYPTADGPVSIAAADFDLDHKTDLAVCNELASSFSLLHGNGDGTFRAHVDFDAGREPSALIASRFNADRKLDLAITNASTSTVSIVLGKGDGTFRPRVAFDTDLTPVALIDGDFDADGKLDLAVANRDGDSVSILLGNGDGTFLPHVEFGAGPGPVSVTRADFNLDGKLDLAVADASTPSFGPGKVSVLLGNGDGTFGSPTSFQAGIRAQAITTGDFNGDGKPDLAVATNLDVFGSVAILIGNGDGTFQPQVSYPTGRFSVFIATGDFNGDRKLDLVVVNQNNNTVTMLVGKGDGTFELQAHYATGDIPSSLALGDFNADGEVDMAVANLVGSVSVFVSTR
jgi:hypothetical protein